MAEEYEEEFGEDMDTDEEIVGMEDEEEEEWNWEEADNGGSDERSLVPITDLIGKVIEIEGYVTREGSFGDYVSVLIKGEKVFNTGSTRLMAKLKRANRLGKLPARLVIGSTDLDGGRVMYQFHLPKKGDKVYK